MAVDGPTELGMSAYVAEAENGACSQPRAQKAAMAIRRPLEAVQSLFGPCYGEGL
jgi:hypothetical protein